MSTEPPHRHFRLTDGTEPPWFRWLVLLGICLGIALIVTGWLRVWYP